MSAYRVADVVAAESLPVRSIGLALFGAAGGLLVAFVGMYMVQFGAGPDDARTYFAAGERLNAGGELYRLSPGDRRIPPELMGAGTDAPLLSPPLIAGIWRPLALLPEPVAVWAWWTAMALLIVGTLLAIAHANPMVAAGALLGAGAPLIWQVSGANLNALVISGGTAIWLLARAGHPFAAGVVACSLAVLKLTPVLLVLWLLVTTVGRLRQDALRGVLVGGGAATAIAVAAAGVESHFAYLEVVRDAATTPTAYSLGGLLQRLGVATPVATLAAPLIAIACTFTVILLRSRPRLTFGLASITMVVGFAPVQVHSFALLLVAAAPLAWAWPRTHRPRPSTSAPRMPGA